MTEQQAMVAITRHQCSNDDRLGGRRVGGKRRGRWGRVVRRRDGGETVISDKGKDLIGYGDSRAIWVGSQVREEK